MSIRTVDCSFCKGSGEAQRLEEKAFDGSWVPNTAFNHSSHSDIDAMIASSPDFANLLRWNDCTCPRCDGVGEYEVEYTACRIF